MNIPKIVREELPEINEISDRDLADKVVEAWSLSLEKSSFLKISDMGPSGGPERPRLIKGTQVDHIRGVKRLAMKMADEMAEMFPDIGINRDTVIAGALLHDVGKPWEFDPENIARWTSDTKRTGNPSLRHTFYGVHIGYEVGLPEEIIHIIATHAREGDQIVRSLVNQIISEADHAFWRILKAGGWWKSRIGKSANRQIVGGVKA